MKSKLLGLFCILVLLVTGCNKLEKDPIGEVYYKYVCNVVEILNNMKEPIHKEGINYTLTLNPFDPVEGAFDKYNKQFSADFIDNKYVDLTDRTRYYIKQDKKKVSATFDDIKPGDLLELWIHPFMDDWLIEAIEINIIRN